MSSPRRSCHFRERANPACLRRSAYANASVDNVMLLTRRSFSEGGSEAPASRRQAPAIGASDSSASARNTVQLSHWLPAFRGMTREECA